MPFVHPNSFVTPGHLPRHPAWVERQKDRLLHYILESSERFVRLDGEELILKLGLTEHEIVSLAMMLEEETQIMMIVRDVQEDDVRIRDPYEPWRPFRRIIPRLHAVRRPAVTRYLDRELVELPRATEAMKGDGSPDGEGETPAGQAGV